MATLRLAVVILGFVLVGTDIAAAPLGSGRIAFISDRGGKSQIYVMNADGSNIRLLSDLPGQLSCCTPLASSPDGRKIAVASPSGGSGPHIYIVNADGTNMTRVISPLGAHDDPALSPDGRRIAFVSRYRLHYAQIFVAGVDGSNFTRLTNLSGDSYNPAFSPDGRRIAFDFGGTYTSRGIYTMNVDGSNVTRLTEGISYLPAFSPEGRIAFSSDRKTVRQLLDRRPPTNSKERNPELKRTFRIFIMSPDGSNVVFLADSPMEVGVRVSFSLDGRKIAVGCGEKSVCVMNADGSNMVTLTSGWGPVFVQ